MKRSTLALRNLARNRGAFALASSGVVLGVATLCFFVALGAGVQTHILDRIFVADQLEVVPATVQIGAFGLGGGGGATGLDDALMDEIRAVPGVRSVHPRLHLRFPGFASGGEEILGDAFWTELIGDGLPPELLDPSEMADDPLLAFRDWEGPCADDDDCGPAGACEAGICVGEPCLPDDEIATSSDRAALERLADEVARSARLRRRNLTVRESGPEAPEGERWRLAVQGRGVVAAWDAARERPARGWRTTDLETAGCDDFPAWCGPETRRCEMPVPVLVSNTLLELYNSNVQSVLGGLAEGRSLPRLSEEALIGFGFRGHLGRGFVGASRAVASEQARERTVRFRVVGFSDRAIPLGVTVPMGYAARWNAVYRGADDAAEGAYDSLLVLTDGTRDLHRVADTLQGELGLQLDPRWERARRASLTIALLMGVIALFSLLVTGLAALNIMNTYLMLVAQRRHEVGVLRAVGAPRRAVYGMILGEALVTGLVSVLLALALCEGGMALADMAFARATPDFPFKPETLFARPVWWVPLALGVGVGFCVAGASIPAARAARMDPSEALRGA